MPGKEEELACNPQSRESRWRKEVVFEASLTGIRTQWVGALA